MPRGRKLTTEQVQQAAVDRRNGMSWRELSIKYDCAVNTIRFALSDYSDEFNPLPPIARSSLESQLQSVQSDFAKLKKILKKRFNVHI